MLRHSKVNWFEFPDGESQPIVRSVIPYQWKICVLQLNQNPCVCNWTEAVSVSPVLKNVTIAVMSNRQCRAIFRHIISGNVSLWRNNMLNFISFQFKDTKPNNFASFVERVHGHENNRRSLPGMIEYVMTYFLRDYFITLFCLDFWF